MLQRSTRVGNHILALNGQRDAVPQTVGLGVGGLFLGTLLTLDAQWLYEPLGFMANNGGRFTYMERVPTTAY